MAQRFVRQTSLVLSLLVVSCTATLLLCLLMDQLEKPAFRRPPVALHQDQPLLNMTNFHLLTSPYACHPEEEVKALMVITSHAGDRQGRMARRNGMPLKVFNPF